MLNLQEQSQEQQPTFIAPYRNENSSGHLQNYEEAMLRLEETRQEIVELREQQRVLRARQSQLRESVARQYEECNRPHCQTTWERCSRNYLQAALNVMRQGRVGGNETSGNGRMMGVIIAKRQHCEIVKRWPDDAMKPWIDIEIFLLDHS